MHRPAEAGWAIRAVMRIADSVSPAACLTRLRARFSLIWGIMLTASGVIKMVVDWFLVAIHSLNIAGAAMGSICCFAFIVVFNVAAIFRLFPEKLSLARMFLRPLVSTAVMSAAVWAVYSLLERTFSDRSGFIYTAIATLAAVAVGVAVYAVLIIVTKALRKEDLALLPKGEKIALYLKLK